MRVTVSFFRKYAGGTLLDTSSLRIPAFRCTYMNKYQYLLSKKESGELSILFNDFELPLKYQQWMDIYEYHLEHPKKSQWQVSLAFRVSKGTVWNAYRFMEKVI